MRPLSISDDYLSEMAQSIKVRFATNEADWSRHFGRFPSPGAFMPPFPTFNENLPETRKSRFDGNVRILKGQFRIFFHFFLPADFSGQFKNLGDRIRAFGVYRDSLGCAMWWILSLTVTERKSTNESNTMKRSHHVPRSGQLFPKWPDARHMPIEISKFLVKLGDAGNDAVTVNDSIHHMAQP
jgi:hypothetical protein